MPQCDRCGDEIPISTTDVDIDGAVTEQQLREIHEPSDAPFTIIEGAFAVWTSDLDVEQRGRFPLLLCRQCTQAFIKWVDNPAVTPEQEETYDFTIDWSYTDN